MTKIHLLQRMGPAALACLLSWPMGASADNGPASLIRLADLAGGEVIALPAPDGQVDALGLPSSQSAVNLAELVRLGLGLSPQIRQSQAQLDAARSARKVAQADWMPSFSLRHATGPEASSSAGAATDKHRYRVSTVRLTQPLYNAPLTQEWRYSTENEAAAQSRSVGASDNVANAVVRSTVDLSAARLVLDFSNVQLAQLQSILDYLEERVKAGASSASDLERAKSRVYAARQTRMEQQAAYRTAAFELKRWVQQTPQALRLPTISDFPQLPPNSAELKALALERNPEILALQRDMAAQQARVDAEWSKYKPVVGFSLEHDESRNVRGVNGPNTDVRALLVINWAMSLGGKEWHQAQQALAELQQKEARLEDEKQRLAQALDIDLTLLESANFRVQTAQLEQVAAGKVMEAVQEQLRSGRLGSLLDALDASERFFASRQRLVQAIAQNLKAHAQLLTRIGQLGDLRP